MVRLARIMFSFFLLSLGAPVFGQVTFIAPTVAADPGDTVTVSITFDAAEVVFGFQYGLCADPPFGDITIGDDVDIVPGADLAAVNGGSGPDFFQVESEPGANEGSHTVGCLIDFLGSVGIPVGSGQEVVDVTFQAEDTGIVSLCFCDFLGMPPINAAYVNAAGQSVSPTTVCGEFVVGDPCVKVAGFNGSFDQAAQEVTLTWSNPIAYAGHDVLRNGVIIGSIAGGATSFVDPTPEASSAYSIESTCAASGGTITASGYTIEFTGGGDVDGDGMTGIGDAIFLLNFLFAGGIEPGFLGCP